MRINGIRYEIAEPHFMLWHALEELEAGIIPKCPQCGCELSIGNTYTDTEEGRYNPLRMLWDTTAEYLCKNCRVFYSGGFDKECYEKIISSRRDTAFETFYQYILSHHTEITNSQVAKIVSHTQEAEQEIEAKYAYLIS